MITELYVLFVCLFVLLFFFLVCECKSVVGWDVLYGFLFGFFLHPALIFRPAILQAQLHAMTQTKSAFVEIDCINVFIHSIDVYIN